MRELSSKSIPFGFGALSNQPRGLPTMTCVGDVEFMHGLLRYCLAAAFISSLSSKTSWPMSHV